MASSARGKPKELEAMILGRILMRKEEVEGRYELIEGLLDFLVENKIWPCLRKVYEEIGKWSQEKKERHHNYTMSFIV